MGNISFLENLEKLKKSGLVEAAFLNIKKWLEGDEYKEFWGEIEQMIAKEDIAELNDAFYQMIPFGTAGRRGKMGVGTNRINVRAIAESAQGFSEYLIECFGANQTSERGVVVTYDVRHHSLDFAKITAQVFSANGIKAYFFDNIRSTPQLSFTIRYKKAIGGVMISASHNPPSDNGIKVYWEHGGQVVPPHDANIIKKVSEVKGINLEDFEAELKAGKIVMLDESADKAYAEAVGNLSLGDYRDVHVVFTPLHGCASTSFLPVLRRVGFNHIDEVAEQMTLDPDFSQVAKQIPNPEVPISLGMATDQAKKSHADLVVAADPDADRIGVVSRESLASDNYIFLNGNQIGVLIFDYITRELKKKNALPANGVLVKTVVTTDLLTKIAEDNNLETIPDLPVGFKYIADAIENRMLDKVFLFGAEESHGYLYGDYARDKDGAVAALLICEYAALLKKEGRTLYEQLENIKREYGYYRELLL
ncbi:phospho-sugar mutase, partial [Patescibacteria group bacterium]|nr:phospho-sugar mutase [Patescibacteria group bacterium]